MNKIVLPFLSLLVIISLNGCATSSELPGEPTHTQQIDTVTPTLQPTSISTEQPTLEIDATPSATATPTAEPIPEATVEPTAVPTSEAAKKPIAKPTATPTAKPTQNPSGTPKPTVVQRANPDTGISWDGKSAIVYTYSDGSTGTVPKPGATYEQLPGRFNTIPQSNTSSVYDGICSKCGKKEGDGTNGTCVQWLMKDVDCPNCGKHVQVRTCHTCNEATPVPAPTPAINICRHCGKKMGNGTNGTCIRYSLIGTNMPCPNCGETIPARTCHSCK